jgi:hypothetical protein
MSELCDRCDEEAATRTVKTIAGGEMHLCDYCAEQWDEEYAAGAEEKSFRQPCL